MSLKHETKFDAELKGWLAFAAEKLSEIGLLAKLVNQSGDSAVLLENRTAIASRRQSKRIHDSVVKLRAEAAAEQRLRLRTAEMADGATSYGQAPDHRRFCSPDLTKNTSTDESLCTLFTRSA